MGRYESAPRNESQKAQTLINIKLRVAKKSEVVPCGLEKCLYLAENIKKTQNNENHFLENKILALCQKLQKRQRFRLEKRLF